MQVSKIGMGLKRGITAIAIALSLSVASTGAVDAQQTTIRIGNDRGGLVGARAREIREILGSGSRVEIVGNICLSSCTMYLGAGNVCVRPGTTFGFHGPSSSRGIALSSERFDHWSNVMARHYNEPIRNWFMQEARYLSRGYLRISGSQLINLGYQSCEG